MAQQIVDRLEVVDVEQQHRVAAAVAHVLHRVLERALHAAPVGETGQDVDRRRGARRGDRAVLAQQRAELRRGALEVAPGDERERARRAKQQQRAAQPVLRVARGVRAHRAVLAVLERDVVAGDLQLEQRAAAEPFEIRRRRWARSA